MWKHSCSSGHWSWSSRHVPAARQASAVSISSILLTTVTLQSSTSCACWFTSRFWDTRRNISQTFWHRLPIFQVDLNCVLHRVATSSCRGHVDKLATEPFLLLHREHEAGYRRSWNCCDRQTRFVIWKHFCFILSTGTRIQIDSVMRSHSSSRGRNTSASVTVTVQSSSILVQNPTWQISGRILSAEIHLCAC